ncbi:MAG: hypothetical protein L0Z07_09940 [Planctomycetes bacterium]|nr:hypothetical protein [Planctomycetota bacterium]
MIRRRHRRLLIETLEDRSLLAANLANGMLTVVATNQNDNIQVQVASAGPNVGQLEVNVNGAESFFDVNQVTGIQIFGLGGNDTITVDDNVTINTSIHGGKGNDAIKGGSGNDTIHGDAGNDTLDGSSGDDTIFGDKGNDSLQGGDDNDTAYGNSGNDSVAGGTGDDVLSGDNGNDSLYGDDGNDTCRGSNGKDTLHGGAGQDLLHGDNGRDVVFGNYGNDILYGDNGSDAIWGGEDDDHLEGGRGSDDCHGGSGDDQLKGDQGHDRLDGDDGDDLLDGDDGDDMEDGIEADLDSEFKAFLAGIGNMSGKAEFEIENENGQIVTKFELEVAYLAANSTFDVIIDGVTVGQLGTDGLGEGELEFSSIPSGGELPFPAGFPSIHLGSTIQVASSLQGSFIQKYHS